jgi:NADH-quinone oxidoreductase subunit L
MGIFLLFAWLIVVFPLAAAVLITLTPIRHNKTLSGWLAIACMLIATLWAAGVAWEVAQGVHISPDGVVMQQQAGESALHGDEQHFSFPQANVVRTFRWAPTSGDNAMTMGYLIDPVVAAMLLMVTIASSCIHLFSLGYMAHDPRQSRFFSFISLFTAAMLLMLMSSNLLLFFMAWEVMGLCSYLLIGFWYDKDYADPQQINPRRAAIKAFITTRIGDVLFLIGLVYLWNSAGSLDFGAATGQIFHPETLERLQNTSVIFGISSATAIALLIFAGTVGKSAQFPLHVWLPDAMEGPTPVSALIHAATMVAAGVFLVGRTFPIFEASNALPVVAFIGAFTALFAALIAVAQFDIKRILAYSTLSQLGFMVAALGIGGWVAAIFHLITHAFFKALLFLGSGSVIHGMEATVGHDSNTSQDIRNMGGLRRWMPITWLTYMAGYLALAGVPPLAGFWSKDEILADAWNHGHWVVWIVLALASLLTAFYMTRQVLLVFFGEFRGYQPREAQHLPAHPHDPPESPWSMTTPLVVLAVLAVLVGLINLPGLHWFADYLQAPAGQFNPVVMLIAIVIAGLGIFGGWSLYRNAFATADELDPLERMMPAVFTALNQRLYIDQMYAKTIGVLTEELALAWEWIDEQIINRALTGLSAFTLFLGRFNFILDDALLNDGVDGTADNTKFFGDRIRQSITGRFQDYAAIAFIGVVILGVISLYGFGN